MRAARTIVKIIAVPVIAAAALSISGAANAAMSAHPQAPSNNAPAISSSQALVTASLSKPDVKAMREATAYHQGTLCAMPPA